MSKRHVKNVVLFTAILIVGIVIVLCTIAVLKYEDRVHEPQQQKQLTLLVSDTGGVEVDLPRHSGVCTIRNTNNSPVVVRYFEVSIYYGERTKWMITLKPGQEVIYETRDSAGIYVIDPKTGAPMGFFSW